jgi:hypothetical protein
LKKAARAEAEYAQDVQQNKKPPRPTDEVLADIQQAFGIDVNQPPEDVIDAVFDILDQNRGYDKRETWKKAMRLSGELMDALRTPVPVDVERTVKDNVDEALKKANTVIPKIQEAIENSGVTMPCTITVEPGKSDITNVNIYVTVGSAPELSGMGRRRQVDCG